MFDFFKTMKNKVMANPIVSDISDLFDKTTDTKEIRETLTRTEYNTEIYGMIKMLPEEAVDMLYNTYIKIEKHNKKTKSNYDNICFTSKLLIGKYMEHSDKNRVEFATLLAEKSQDKNMTELKPIYTALRDRLTELNNQKKKRHDLPDRYIIMFTENLFS